MKWYSTNTGVVSLLLVDHQSIKNVYAKKNCLHLFLLIFFQPKDNCNCEIVLFCFIVILCLMLYMYHVHVIVYANKDD